MCLGIWQGWCLVSGEKEALEYPFPVVAVIQIGLLFVEDETSSDFLRQFCYLKFPCAPWPGQSGCLLFDHLLLTHSSNSLDSNQT